MRNTLTVLAVLGSLAAWPVLTLTGNDWALFVIAPFAAVAVIADELRNQADASDEHRNHS